MSKITAGQKYKNKNNGQTITVEKIKNDYVYFRMNGIDELVQK